MRKDWIVLCPLLVVFPLAPYVVCIESRVWAEPATIRPLLRSLLVSYYKNAVSGGYWENDWPDTKILSRFSHAERMACYRVLLTYGNLDTSKVYLFHEIVADEEAGLLAELVKFRKTERFYALNLAHREAVEARIRELAPLLPK